MESESEVWLKDIQHSPSMCLFTATNLGLLNRIKFFLLDHNVNGQNHAGWTPLMYAAHSGRLNIVGYLLSIRAACDLQSKKGVTALMLASSVGNVEIVDLLCQSGCKLDLRDQQDFSALHYSVVNKHNDVIKLLITKGAKIDEIERRHGQTSLMMAAIQGLNSTVTLLLNLGADVNKKSNAGDTALSLATMYGHTKVASTITAYRTLYVGQSTEFTCNQEHDLKKLLNYYGLTHYYHLFEEQEIDFELFLTLNESDLVDLGIKNLGPRKKLLKLIQSLLSSGETTDDTRKQ
ncbi:Ankyrin repeat and SAM domain-containing protein 3 [Chamberlinius hualienensis]